ncbi:MAG TPA: sugar-binding protein [bacterium]|nr:sugar-binding protein [bacterium]HPN44735.1 sugar-binding protein [bacterium]
MKKVFWLYAIILFYILAGAFGIDALPGSNNGSKAFAQTVLIGLFDDFSDGVVSPFWQPEHAEDAVPPFVLTEADNALQIVIDKSMAAEAGKGTYGFSAVLFNISADFLLDMTEHPYASVMIKTDKNVPFEFGVADDTTGGNNVTISNVITAGDEYTQLYLDFTGMFDGKQAQNRIAKCYLNFKPGWAAAGVFQGTVWLKDFRLGSEALLPPPPPSVPINIAAHPPAIDGVLDDIWKTGPWYRDYRVQLGAEFVANFSDAAVSWRGMYDDNYLYLFVQAFDDTLVKDSGTETWNDDSYEIWIDGNNSKGTTFDGVDDFGFQFLYSGDAENPLIFNKVTKSGNGLAGDFSGILQGATYTGLGTNLEVAIPMTLLKITPVPGTLVGLEVDWNDDDDGGAKETKIKYFSDEDESWQNPSTLGNIQLTDKVQNDFTEIWYAETAPVIDGVKDATWEAYPTYVLNQYMNLPDSLNSFQDLALDFNVAWDSTYLYYGINVVDDKLIQDGTFAWQDDGIEFWFDGNNSRKTAYDGINDIGLSFPYVPGSPIDSVSMAFGGTAVFAIESIPWAATQTAEGIYLEFALPLDSLGISPTNGWMVGHEVDYNDDDTGGGKERDTKCKTFSDQDLSYTNPSTFGSGKFLGGPGGVVPVQPLPLLIDKTTAAVVIDGVLDSTWFNVRNNNIGIYTGEAATDWFDFYSRFRMKWDSKNLYIFVEVQDDTIIATNADPLQNDGIVLYFDGDNTKNDAATGYDVKDDQVLFVYGQAPVAVHDNVKLTKAEVAYLPTDFGYNVEIKLPYSKGLTFTALADRLIGLEVQINDNDTGVRNTMGHWWSASPDAGTDPSVFGTAKLNTRETSDVLDIHFTAYPIVVDAEEDYAWANVPLIFGNQRMADFAKVSGPNDLEVTWKTLWDMTNLYLLINIKDETFIRDSGTSTWQDDGVELWFDGDHSDKTTYDGINDFGFKMPYNAETILEAITKSNGPAINATLLAAIKQAQKLTADGIILELSFPLAALGMEPGAGTLIGIEVDWNDDDDGGEKDTKLKTYDGTDMSWSNPSLMGVARFLGSPIVSDIKQEAKVASTFDLFQNYPNPFNPTTTINFSLPVDSNVKLVVYDILGRELINLVDKRVQAGVHSVTFNAAQFPSGLYFYKLQAGNNVFIKKMMLIK